MASTPSKSSHTPRKKRKSSSVAFQSDNGALIHSTSTPHPEPAFPLVAFLLPAKGTVSTWVVLPLILMVVGLFRWAIGFWGFSGRHVANVVASQILTFG